MGATISTSRTNATLRGTNDADNLQSSGANSIFLPFGGDDSIYINSAATNSSVLADGYDGDKYFYLQGKNSFIAAGTGDNRFVGYGPDSTIITGNGNNSLMAYVPSVTASFGSGNDTVTAMGAASYFDLGDGENNALLFKGAANTTILGGSGTNNITLTKTPNVTIIIRPGGKTYVADFNETTTLKVTENYTTIRSGADIVVKVGAAGIVTLEGAAELGAVNIVYDHDTILSGTEGDDKAHVTESAVVYNARGGNDSVEVSGDSVTIYGGNGNDTIQGGHIIYTNVLSPTGDTVTVHSSGGERNFFDGCEGNDYLENNGKYADTKDASGYYPLSSEPNHATLLGGAGSDTLINRQGGSFSRLEGGADNDYIYNDADNSTLIGGAGDDTILNSGDNTTMNSGTGNDYISNSGDNTTVTGGAGNKRIFNRGKAALIITSEGNDYIENGNSDVTILSGSGDDTIFNNASYNSRGVLIVNNASYNSRGVLIDGGEGNNFINSRGDNVTVTGGSNIDTVSFTGDDGSISTGAADDCISADSSNNLYIDAGAGNDIVSFGSVLTNSKGEPSYYNLVNNSTISAGSGNKVIHNGGGQNNTYLFADATNSTLYGANETSTIVLGNGDATYTVAELDEDLQITAADREILVIGGATLALNIVGEEVVEDDEPQLRLNGNIATYGTTNETFFKISGVTSLDGIILDDLDDGVITIAQASLGTSTVTISNGYYLNLDYDVDTPVAYTAWTTSGSTVTLRENFTAGYVLTSDSRSIVPQKAKAGSTVAKLTGLKSGLRADEYGELAGIYVDAENQTITLDAEVLTSKTVKVTGDYTLEPGADVEEPTQSEPTFSRSGTKLNLKTATTSGHTLSEDGRSLVFTKASAGKTLVSLSGVNKNLRVENDGTVECVDADLEAKTITLSAGALGNTTVKLTGEEDFTLALDADVPEPTADEITMSVSGNKILIKSAATAGFTLSDDERSAVYTKASTGKTLGTITGVAKGLKAFDGAVEGVDVDIENRVATLYANALGTTNVKVTGDFTLALGEDVEIGEDENIWSVSGTKATFKNVTPASYEVSANEKSILCHKETTNETLATVSGIIKDTAGEDVAIDVDEDTSRIILNSDVLSKKVSVSSAVYGFAFDEEYSNASITGGKGDDTISVAGAELTITGGKGDDCIDLGFGGGNTLVYSKGDGDDVVFGFTEEDNLKVKGGTVKVETDDSNVVISVGTGTITLEDAAGQDISINGKIYSTDDDYVYGVSGSNSMWFTEDDTNFINGGSSTSKLDEISAIEYAVTNFEPTNYENFTATAQLSLAAYTSDK